MAKGSGGVKSGKAPKNRYIYMGLVLAGISVITLLIVFRGSIFTSAAASELTVVEEIDGTDIITEVPVPVVKKPVPVVKKPATIIEKTKEAVQKVKEKITGEGPGTGICKCLHNADINFKDLHFPEFMPPGAVKEKKEVIRIMYKQKSFTKHWLAQAKIPTISRVFSQLTINETEYSIEITISRATLGRISQLDNSSPVP